MAMDNPSRDAPARDRDRALLVLSDDGDLAVGLHEQLDCIYVVVKHARPDEAADAARTCRPWPWMLAGTGPVLPPELAAVLRIRPVLTVWYGRAPATLPARSLVFPRFADLVAFVRSALSSEVLGLQLAPGVGVDLPGGGFARSPELQALVSAHSRPFDLPLATFRNAARVLAHHGVPIRPGRDLQTGLVSLMPVVSSER